MKVKNIICVILATLLLVGCREVEQSAPTENTNTGVQSSGIPSAPEWSVTPGLLTYYVNLPQTAHWSLSTYMHSGVTVMVLSNEKLDSLLHTIVPNDLFSNNGGIGLYAFEDEDASQFPLYLYQTYRGMDWAQMTQLKQAAEAGDKEAESHLQEYAQMYADDYAVLTAEDLPQVYAYLLEIQTGYSESTPATRHHSVKLQFGQDTVSVSLGTLDITNLPLWDGLLEAEELPQQDLEAVQVSYWTDTAQLPAVVIDATQQPQVLTGVAYMGGEVTLADICLTWTENGQTITHQWDGVTPITIPANTPATLSATLCHGGKSVMGYCAGGYLAISRGCEDTNQRLWYSLPLTQHWNVYELYAMVVDGIDLTPYYAYAQGYVPACPVQEDPVQAQNIDLQLLQQQGCSVTAAGVCVDDFAYTLTLRLENETDENTEFLFGNLYINGYRYSYYPSCSVPVGEAVEMEIVFPWEELYSYGITEKKTDSVFLIEMNLTVQGENAQELIDNQSMTALYTQGVAKAPTPTVLPDMTLLLDTETFTLWIVTERITQGSIFGEHFVGAEQYCSQVLFVNKSNQKISFKITGAKVNGQSVSTGYGCLIPPGRFVTEEYVVCFLQGYPWDVVEEVTLSVTAEASDRSWKEYYTVTYRPNLSIHQEVRI